MDEPQTRQYGRAAKLFHWLVVVLLAIQFTLGWLMPGIQRGMQPENLTSLHISFGFAILLAMLLLSLSRGLNFAEFTAASGCDARALFAEVIERLGGQGLLEVDNGSLRLSDVGLPVADAIAAEFLSAAAAASP